MSSLNDSRGQKTLVMTGGTGGIGRRTVDLILDTAPGWRILLLARPSDRLDRLAASRASDRLQVIPVELGDLGSTRGAARSVLRRLDGAQIDALALNAGIQPVMGDGASADGLELCFAVNHLAHFLLADVLSPAMADGGRVVITSSEVHDPEAFCLVGITRATWEDPEMMADPQRAQAHLTERVDRGEARYCASKLLNLMHARYLSANESRFTSVAFNPSVVPGTEIARDRNALQILGWKYVMPLLAPLLPGARTIDRSAGDLAWLITAADLSRQSGCYFDGREAMTGSLESCDSVKISRMADVSRQLIAAKLSEPMPVRCSNAS